MVWNISKNKQKILSLIIIMFLFLLSACSNPDKYLPITMLSENDFSSIMQKNGYRTASMTMTVSGIQHKEIDVYKEEDQNSVVIYKIFANTEDMKTVLSMNKKAYSDFYNLEEEKENCVIMKDEEKKISIYNSNSTILIIEDGSNKFEFSEEFLKMA